MGNVRNRIPRCMKCSYNRFEAYGGYRRVGGWHVLVERWTNDGAYMKCQDCGHGWYSQAKYLKRPAGGK